jgi:capsid portal protein
VNEDPFAALSSTGKILEPPFNLLALATLPEQNTELTPIIETVEQNVDGFGYRLVPSVNTEGMSKNRRATIERSMRKEKVRLTNFFRYASLKDSFKKLRKKNRKDYESTGNA